MKNMSIFRVGLTLTFAVLITLMPFVVPSDAEVSLFVDKNTVRVNDPALGQQSILNNFGTQGHRTHNNMALVWNSSSVWVYDIRIPPMAEPAGFLGRVGAAL